MLLYYITITHITTLYDLIYLRGLLRIFFEMFHCFTLIYLLYYFTCNKTIAMPRCIRIFSTSFYVVVAYTFYFIKSPTTEKLMSEYVFYNVE